MAVMKQKFALLQDYRKAKRRLERAEQRFMEAHDGLNSALGEYREISDELNGFLVELLTNDETRRIA